MGDVLTKNLCVNFDETLPPPKHHFKCRYHEDDEFCLTAVYTRTKDILRFPVPRNKIKWSVEYREYKPLNFTSEKILLKDGKNYKDLDVLDPGFKNIAFNEIDCSYNCDRKSHHGPYRLVPFSNDCPGLVPRNPVGRTGLIGRGHLGRWGPNHAADPIVTTWKRDQNGKILRNRTTGLGILQFVAIQRRDTQEYAIPGGMRDPGEIITKTLVREFTEEALNMNNQDISFDKNGHIIGTTGNLEKKINEFFKNGTQIYKGYVDDPRNTDNAWMETIACNFHDETGEVVGSFKLEGGDDATKAQWMELGAHLKLFASHKDFLRQVAAMHDAHWSSPTN